MKYPFLHKHKYDEKDIDSFIEDNTNPVLISFMSPKNQLLVTIPVWTIYQDSKFYVFTGKKSLKVRAIKSGNQNFSITIVDKNSFPDVYSSTIPYIAISGIARIQTLANNEKIAEIHLKLLEKYRFEGDPGWVSNLVQQLKNKPEDAWLIEITPQICYTFNE
ncbi:MAG: hypothetical protein ACXAC7_04750 [Candidatus Hodarchaeales archaeon]|jgi:general stress protein 26